MDTQIALHYLNNFFTCQSTTFLCILTFKVHSFTPKGRNSGLNSGFTHRWLCKNSLKSDVYTINIVYKMTFERKTGILTPEGTAEVKTTNCPNCGAPTKITSAGKCEYCGSIITTGANTWVLSGLEPLRN